MVLPRYLAGEGSPSGYPKLATYADEQRPETVRFVDPERLEQDFGPGTRLRRFWAQIADEPITTGLTKRLGWLVDYAEAGKMLDGTKPIMISDNLARSNLGAGSFSSEARSLG